MRTSIRLCVLILAILATAFGQARISLVRPQASKLPGRSEGLLTPARFQPPAPPAPKLIRAGRVLDVRIGTYLADQGILTDGERIKEIGPWGQVKVHAPADAVLIDLSGQTLLPGLIDCHAHL